MSRRDPNDPGGEYYREGYELNSEVDDVFCAKEGLTVAEVKHIFRPSITRQVIEVILEREKKGTRKYGHPIDPFDGRDWLNEAIEECADMLQYLVTAREKLSGRG